MTISALDQKYVDWLDGKTAGSPFAALARVVLIGTLLNSIIASLNDVVAEVDAGIGADNLTDLASTANGKGASLIGVEDAGSFLAAADVEAALAEVAEPVLAQSADGLVVKRVARATFDPSANSGERTIGAHGLGVTIPDNAVVTRTWYDVITTFQSAGADAGTIALKAEGANDVVSAVAISDGGNPWDAGLHDAIQTGAASAFVKTTAARELTATVAGQALTAGKLVLFAEYTVSA